MASFTDPKEALMAPRSTPNPLTVRCALCAWNGTGRAVAMLAAQREHRQVHPRTTTEGRPQ
jgi:hypothetical protein